MKIKLNKGWFKVSAIVAGFVAMIVYAGGFLHRKTSPDTLPVSFGKPVPDHARIIDVAMAGYAPLVEVVGTTASDRRIQISSRISAYVNDILVRAGDTVTNGQVLAQLDQRELKEQLAAAEAQLTQASSEFRRAKQLFEKEATTEQAVTAASSAFHAAKAQVDRMQVMISYATITSPIDGVVTERAVEAGDLANPGQLLLGLYDPHNMRLEVPVPVRLTSRFELGQKVKAELDHPAAVFDAEVTEIVGEIDPSTRTQRVKLRLVDTGGRVLPGAFGRIRVEEDPRPTLFIPASAVFRVGQLTMVHVVRGDRMVQRLVRTGITDGDRIEILSGLSDGDRLVDASIKE